MKFKFVPSNLIKAKEEIIAKHTAIGEPSSVNNSREFMDMIKRLASLSKEEAEEEALVLTKDNLENIARYLPHNDFKVRMENLFLIFRLRYNLKLCWILFYEWQNMFDNQECNEFLKAFVLESVEFKQIMNSCHFTSSLFKTILEEENIPIAYGKQALLLEELNLQSLKEKLAYLGIKESSILMKECEFLFYTYCSAHDYLQIKEEELLRIVQKYGDVAKKLFLQNFLQKLSLTQLKRFNKIAKCFVAITGERKSNKFNLYFSTFEFALVKKYIDWINIYKINEIFENDSRSEFWEKYHCESVRKYNFSNSIIIEFENYMAIEFLGQDMGPAYIYKKEYFEKEIEKLFLTRRYDNAELRSQLYKNTDYINGAKLLQTISGTRLIHRPNPGWQHNFTEAIYLSNITHKII